MSDKLNEKRDELIERQLRHFPYELSEQQVLGFKYSLKDVWNALRQELENAAGEFDEDVAKEESEFIYVSIPFQESFRQGAEWQHSQDKAAIGLANERAKIEKDLRLTYEDILKQCNRSLRASEEKIEQLEKDLSHLKGDRDKFLASDDCYYWTPEKQKEIEVMKIELAEAKQRIADYEAALGRITTEVDYIDGKKFSTLAAGIAKKALKPGDEDEA